MKSTETKQQRPLHVGIFGSADFCRRVNAVLVGHGSGIKTCQGTFAEAWGVLLSQRPTMVIVEIGVQYTERKHAWLRGFLAQLRERFGNEIYVAIALLSPWHLAFGGDLLFQDDHDLVTSGFVDTFIVTPPGTMPSIPTISDQVLNVVSLFRHELGRRADGGHPLPPLGAEGWVQSLADPKSRELWMKWLPRYASYTNENPLILGETGTGKTNLAYALHLLAGRSGKFIGITPRDFSSSELVQAELFGAVEGAYTGAVDKWGLVRSAEKGTLFIDELQSIDKDLQGKLITFIENKTYRRVGSTQSIEADVRFVFATNKSLYDMLQTNVLRDDFAYRLERVLLELQPLRLRRLDISSALAYALAKVHRQRPHKHLVRGVNTNAYRMLFSHSWPGNLRQLENNVAKLCEITDMKGEAIIDEEAVIEVFESKLSGAAATSSEVISQAAHKLAREAMGRHIDTAEAGAQQFMRLMRTSALEATGGDLEKASAMIGDNKKLMSYVAQDLVTKAELGENS